MSDAGPISRVARRTKAIDPCSQYGVSEKDRQSKESVQNISGQVTVARRRTEVCGTVPTRKITSSVV